MNHTSLGALEEAQQDATAAARRRIEEADQYLHYYRAELFRVQEPASHPPPQQGIPTPPDSRPVRERVPDDITQTTHGGTQAIGRLDKDLTAMTRQHLEEREQFLTQQR